MSTFYVIKQAPVEGATKGKFKTVFASPTPFKTHRAAQMVADMIPVWWFPKVVEAEQELEK